MPIPVITQAPGIVWDFVGSFPYPRVEDIFPASVGNPVNRTSTSVGWVTTNSQYLNRKNCHTNNFLAAAFALRSDTGGPAYLQIESGGAGTGILSLDAFACECDTGSGFALAEGAQHQSQRRVWWLSWLMQSPTANLEQRSGLLCIPAWNDMVTRWIDNPATLGGWGFVGDGAGQWTYRSYSRAAPSTIRESIALPAHDMTLWNQFELVVIGARFGIPATLAIWFNGSLVATRNWTGADLENYQIREWRYSPVMGGGTTNAAGAACNFADVVNKQGRFDRAGTEIG